MKRASVALILALAAASPASADQWFDRYIDNFQRQTERQRDEGQRRLERQTDSYGWNHRSYDDNDE